MLLQIAIGQRFEADHIVAQLVQLAVHPVQGFDIHFDALQALFEVVPDACPGVVNGANGIAVIVVEGVEKALGDFEMRFGHAGFCYGLLWASMGFVNCITIL